MILVSSEREQFEITEHRGKSLRWVRLDLLGVSMLLDPEEARALADRLHDVAEEIE